MKMATRSTAVDHNVRNAKAKVGKRSLYSPDLGASNYRKAQEGRFANHPAFLACKNLEGVKLALQGMITNREKIGMRTTAVARQIENALSILRDEVKKLGNRSDKLRFAEAIEAFFNPQKTPDEKVWRVCWRAIEMRSMNPSQAELRRAVEKDGDTFSDEQWKRLMKRSGLNKELPTHREKHQGGVLRKV